MLRSRLCCLDVSLFAITAYCFDEKLLSGFRRLAAPAHLIALSCESAETERKITDLLQENDVNYKRSNNDIEILYTNAKAAKGGNSDAE